MEGDPSVKVGLALLLGVAMVGFAGSPSERAVAADGTVSSQTTNLALASTTVVQLAHGTTHVGLAWAGHHAELSVAFSHDGATYGPQSVVAHDESARDEPSHADGHRYATSPALSSADDHHDELVRSGALWTGGARFMRLTANEPLASVTVYAINAGPSRLVQPVLGPRLAVEAVEQPQIITRAAWGANESWRFDAEGAPLWPEEFFAVQKLIVHHTAGINDDPDPAATVRAIQYYQAIERGWGDIGYNFLIDEQGRIYEGRYSREYGPDEVPSATNLEGDSVQGAHVANHNSGTVGIALLGNLVNQDATPAARAALEQLLAWLAEMHGIDPLGEGLYVNPHPDGFTQKHNPNITGHRDWAATLCPGGTFYASLPSLRERVAALVAGEPPPPPPPAVTVPAAPELTAIRAPKARGIRLTWTVPNDGGSAITGYRVLRLKKGSFVRIAKLGSTTTSWRDRNARSGRTYTYVVRAVNAKGVGPFSNQASAVAR